MPKTKQTAYVYLQRKAKTRTALAKSLKNQTELGFENRNRFLTQIHTGKDMIKARYFFDNFIITVFILFNLCSSVVKTG
jgi:hypothetical protein